MYQSDYFINESAEKIFYLVKMTGEAKTRILGITRKHFSDPKEARAWRNNLLKLVHPDNCKHPDAIKATGEVERIYQEMIAKW